MHNNVNSNYWISQQKPKFQILYLRMVLDPIKPPPCTHHGCNHTLMTSHHNFKLIQHLKSVITITHPNYLKYDNISCHTMHISNIIHRLTQNLPLIFKYVYHQSICFSQTDPSYSFSWWCLQKIGHKIKLTHHNFSQGSPFSNKWNKPLNNRYLDGFRLFVLNCVYCRLWNLCLKMQSLHHKTHKSKS